MSSTEHTFQYQDSIKKLPIPDPKDTCTRYLEILHPLQSVKDHEKTRAAVDQFLKSRAASYLNNQLWRYTESRPSYIEEFWYDSYLKYNSPIVINLNPFFFIEDDPSPVQPSQEQRAAAVTMSSLKFIRALKRNELPPDKIKGRPLDMFQYTKLFGSARIPTTSGCRLQTESISGHIVVLSRSQFYWFNVIDKNHNLCLDEEGIRQNYQQVVKGSHNATKEEELDSSFGLLTTENRRKWAKIRNNELSTINKAALEIIDSALFVVCLDDVEIDRFDDLALNFLCGTSQTVAGVQVGTCANRWYDKLQLMVTRNAKVGINFEHTGVDGHTVLRFVGDIYEDTILRSQKSVDKRNPPLWLIEYPYVINKKSSLSTTPIKLNWDVTTELSLKLRSAEASLSDLISQTEFHILEFEGYGSNFIKRLRCSPDAFVQMSFQAAYYALYGTSVCTYEPAMTKIFSHGRTEAIRPVSNESNEFVQKFFKEADAEEKLSLLRKACNKHSQRMKEASLGYGVDRHLYALYCIWKRGVDREQNTSREVPPIFADKGWDILNNSILSTSNCGNPALRLFGFGPTATNGLGLSYIIKPGSLTIAACSKHRQTEQFLKSLSSFYTEITNCYAKINLEADIDKNAAKEASSTSSSVKDILKCIKDKFRELKVTESASNTVSRTSTDGATSGPSSLPLLRNISTALSSLLGGYSYFGVGKDEGKGGKVKTDENEIPSIRT